MNAPAFQSPPHPVVAELGVEPVPVGPYCREEWFELEKEAIFKRVWLHVGHVCELPEPGAFILRYLDFAKASILITRGKDGAIRAFHNACTHRGTQLTQEPGGKRSSFTCPYHGWTFNNDGELRSAPDFERFYVAKKDCALTPVSVDVCAGLLFVNLDPEPSQNLKAYIGETLVKKLETLPVAKATTFSEYSTKPKPTGSPPTTTSRSNITCGSSIRGRARRRAGRRIRSAIRRSSNSTGRIAPR